MFTLFEPGGMRVPYVPGAFRQRNVEKISKASPTVEVKVGQENSPSDSQKNAGPSSLQARLYEQVESFTQSSRAKIFARDIMSSPVVTLPVTSSLALAWDVVHSRRFRHIPILGAEDMVVGMLSDRDLFRGTMESVLSGATESNTKAGGSIQHLVSRPVLVASPEAELCALARVLLEEHIGALPIVSEAVGLVGMITRSDILRALVAHPDFDQWV
ncbi:CBS domain-containing protein [Candidatus Nitrospira neomarina]|uniref:CBS domain-containing protein n=1 Tax=Candidatus Nitrospira neomarina TaxID=3020899 RepID=A0AA96GIQ9_9BACT|nr:CBS domain-containing protein [Candidatus Nitrospira neomarina]WNM62168.1 CBS domain-containing protein [Candidatus Nitrospira neomarina]